MSLLTCQAKKMLILRSLPKKAQEQNPDPTASRMSRSHDEALS